jgi:hypothetical protein
MQSLVLVINALDPVPDDNNVKAGWGAFAIFVLLILAVALLCWSFVKQMRKVKAANEAGVYDEHPAEDSDQLPPTHTRSDS